MGELLRECRRAVRDALPLLRQAKEVLEVVADVARFLCGS
jgi:hypothetical protein